MYTANRQHPLFGEIHNILLKHLGIDQIIERVVLRLGKVEEVYLTGDFAAGKDASIIDLLIIGNVDRKYLSELAIKAEDVVKRKIRYLIITNEEKEDFVGPLRRHPALLLWQKENNYD